MARKPVYTVEQVQQAYARSGNSVYGAARTLGCTHVTVRKYLRMGGWESEAPAVQLSGPEPIEVKPVYVGLSALVGARVVFHEGVILDDRQSDSRGGDA
jgi:hypothetical protein